MPLSPSFAATQPVGEPSVVTITDDSTGSDVAITQRRVYLRKHDGTFLVPEGTATEYINFPIVSGIGDSIDIDALDKDYALDVIVQWLNVSNTVLYSDTQPLGFTSYNEDYDYGLTEILSGNSALSDDNGFRQHKSDLRDFIDSGDKAIERASDIYSAQLCYDFATEIRLDSQYLFNADN